MAQLSQPLLEIQIRMLQLIQWHIGTFPIMALGAAPEAAKMPEADEPLIVEHREGL